ncbi:MAG TPA: hypothetical protein PLO07_08025, partial [Rubrivivax sp.]|nr:hypothetical protein [Rubrivivax sp.]
QRIRERIEAAAADPGIAPEAVRALDGDGITLIMAGDRRLLAIANADARLEAVSRDTLARCHVPRITQAMVDYRAARSSQALRRAALREPPPFVHQRRLGDFAVIYELNVYCGDAQAMNHLRTELHRQVLDVFNEHGVQIMTPSYEGDPESPKVVAQANWFEAPALRPPAGGAAHAAEPKPAP